MASSAPAQAGGIIGARAAAAQPATPIGSDGQAGGAEITAVEVDNKADGAQLSFRLTQPVTPTSFVLPDPDRAIIDLKQVGFSLDPAIGAPGRLPHGRHARKGLLASFRFGQMAPGRSRIVVDLAQPARIVSAATVVVGSVAKLVVVLARTDRATFRKEARDHDIAPVALAPAKAPDAARATVVLDPGHGGPDTGAMVNGIVEKDVTLAFAKMLAGKLEASGAFNVVMTRPNDVFIPLSERVRIARSSGAALMVSIHADTLPENADVSGATVYTVSDKASDAYAAKVAAKENEADAAVGVDGQADKADVNDILFDLTRQETRAYSHVFARTLVAYFKLAARLNKNPQRAAGFVVLKAPDVPSVLLELGYLSSPTDSASLTSDEWREKATGRMAEAIVAYFADQRGPAKAAAGVPLPFKQEIAGATAK